MAFDKDAFLAALDNMSVLEPASRLEAGDLAAGEYRIRCRCSSRRSEHHRAHAGAQCRLKGRSRQGDGASQKSRRRHREAGPGHVLGRLLGLFQRPRRAFVGDCVEPAMGIDRIRATMLSGPCRAALNFL